MCRNPQINAGVCVLIFAATISGCGDDDNLEKRYTVSGTVNYNGEPLKKGKIHFVPEDNTKRGGAGDIEEGAIVNVMTLNPGDGLVAGKYKVMISALQDVDLAGVTKKYQSVAPQTVVARAQAKAKSLIPKKYNNAIDSGLTAEVSPSNRSFNFELKD